MFLRAMVALQRTYWSNKAFIRGCELGSLLDKIASATSLISHTLIKLSYDHARMSTNLRPRLELVHRGLGRLFIYEVPAFCELVQRDLSGKFCYWPGLLE